TPFQTEHRGDGVVHCGDVVVFVVTAGNVCGQAVEQRDAELGACGVTVALTLGAAGAAEIEDGLVVQRTGHRRARIAFQIGGLLTGFEHTGEAHRTGRHVEQVAADVEGQRGRRRFRRVDRAGRHCTVLFRRERTGPVVQVRLVDRVLHAARGGEVTQTVAQEV